MEFFKGAKMVRLRSQHNKYLFADVDEDSIKQQSNGSTASARWTVEFVEGKPDVIRLKSSRSWKYLCASDVNFLLGWTRHRVIQASPQMKSDASVEWEPIKEGQHVKLRTRHGTFLWANGKIRMNSVTHNLPSDSNSQESLLWIVDCLEIDHTAVNDRPDLNLKKEESNYSAAFSSRVEPSPKRETETDDDRAFQDSLSRSSSYSSIPETQVSSYGETPAISEPVEEGSLPYIQKLKNNSSKNSSKSNSLNLESAIADANKLLDRGKNQKEDLLSEPVHSHTTSRPLPLEIRMAKKTLTEAKDLDFLSIVSSDKLKRIEKAINVLVLNEVATKRTANSKISAFRNQFQTLGVDHEKALTDLEEYEVFGEKKAKIKEDLQREVAKARDLQEREEELCEVLEEARKRREELERELERVTSEIKEAEEKQAENEEQIEEVCAAIEQRSNGVKEMEREEEAWRRRKAMAERRLKQVEEDWGAIKVSLQAFA